MDQKISVYGLGKLGCTMMACFAHKGWEVTGVDVIERTVDNINKGYCPIYEPQVADLIQNNKARIRATTDGIKATLETDVSFVIVPTPSRRDGSFSIEFVEDAIRSIGQALKEKEQYHLVIVTSTVMPGDTERMADILEDVSGKTCGEHFGVCYNPDFIALGKVVHDFLNPDMILIGESDKKAGDILEKIHEKLIDNDPTIHRMSFHNAELAKIGLNSYCVMKICFANIIGEICERMPTGDAEKVLDAIGADTRVGKKYFKPGLAAAGPCFPRDSRAFKSAARSLDIDFTFSEAADEINSYHKNTRIPTLLLNILNEKSVTKIAVLGVAYKEDINVIDESASIEAIKQLARSGVSIKVFDPASNEVAKKELEDFTDIEFCSSAKECIEGTAVCFIGTPWKEFKKLTVEDFTKLMGENPTIFDSWGIYRNSEIDASPDIDYRRIGKLNADINTLIPFLTSDNE